MNTKTLIALLMAGAGLASCSQPIPSYTVMGNIPDSTFNGKTVYIFDRDKGQNIDSAVIENGAFKSGKTRRAA